jgi:hypothetical protein
MRSLPYSAARAQDPGTSHQAPRLKIGNGIQRRGKLRGGGPLIVQAAQRCNSAANFDAVDRMVLSNPSDKLDCFVYFPQLQWRAAKVPVVPTAKLCIASRA